MMECGKTLRPSSNPKEAKVVETKRTRRCTSKRTEDGTIGRTNMKNSYSLLCAAELLAVKLLAVVCCGV